MYIDQKYFKEYRNKLGFTNQNGVKEFFGAKDIIPTVDYGYIELLNERLHKIVSKLNDLVVDDIKVENLDIFCKHNITEVSCLLRENKIIQKLNNQGRRPEEVYFNWMRGHVISHFFLNALSKVFQVNIENIDLIGDDDLKHIDTFKRSPKADLQINLKDGNRLRVEIQSGFQGVNDIKQHKVIESKKIKREEGVASIVVHFDLFNGQVAFVKIDDIDDDSVNWITRQQMEGQTVFNIDQNFFMWKLTEFPPVYNEMSFFKDIL